jgi:hypothetical protein
LGERVSNPILIPAHTSSNIKWESTEPTDTDIKVYTGVTDSDTEEPVKQPDDISDLELWLKADALSLNNNDAVATWTDSSGNENDATQATSGNRPVFKTNILNGKPVVRFDGTDDWMSVPSSTGLFKFLHDGTGATVFVVFLNQTIDTTNRMILDSGGQASSATGFHFEIIGDEWTTRINGGAEVINEGIAATSNHRRYVCFHGTSRNPDFYARIDDSEVADVDYSSTPSTGNSNYDLNIGRNPRLNARFYGGDIAEIIMYSKILSSDEVEAVEGYLSDKYDIAEIEPHYPSEATNDSTIPDLVAGKYLWVKQELTTEDTDETPKLESLRVEIK